MSKFKEYLERAEKEDVAIEVPFEEAAEVTQVEFFGNRVKGTVNGAPFVDTIMSFKAKRPNDWAAIEKALSNNGISIEAFAKDDKTNIDFSIMNGVAKIVDVGEMNAYQQQKGGGEQAAEKPQPLAQSKQAVADTQQKQEMAAKPGVVR
jgi:hypothetical protein